jgi:tRNA threonylcarbamoyladenosine biosynthesis protein TsaE
MQTSIVLNTLEDTEQMAEKIASEIVGGQILALSGPVGAGKTTFAKLFAAALGIEKTVLSPTYTLLQPYTLPKPIRGITTLIHIDAYRLESPAELSAIGFEDFLNDPTTIILLEWAENVAELLNDQPVIWMNFEIDGDLRVCKIKG